MKFCADSNLRIITPVTFRLCIHIDLTEDGYGTFPFKNLLYEQNPHMGASVSFGHILVLPPFNKTPNLHVAYTLQ